MADDRRSFAVQVPAGTPIFPPGQFPITMPVARIQRVDWRVPLGAQSALGWALGMKGIPVIPAVGQPFVVAAGETGTFDGGNLPDSGDWQVLAFNTGQFPHTVFLTFHLLFPTPTVAARTLLTVQDLAEVADLSTARPPLPPRGFPL